MAVVDSGADSGADPGVSHAGAYFDVAATQFDGMAASGATVARDLTLAGRRIRIRVAAGGMERAVLPGLAHLFVSGAGAADLTIDAWDSDSTGAPPLAPAWAARDYGRDGFVRGFNDDRFHTAIQFDPVIFRMIDTARRRALYWTRSASKLPPWELGAPLRPLLHEWLRRSGLLALHGGAVGRADGGVLLAGAGGRGKSNVALACLASDLLYASDDFCCLSRSTGWTVHSLYCTGKISAADLVRHPHLSGAASNPDRLDREKALFFLNERFPDRLIRDMPLRAIVLPRVIGHGASEMVPASSAAAHKAIAMSTIELSRWTAADTFADVADLVRALPCYELRVGASLADVPARLADLIDGLS